MEHIVQAQLALYGNDELTIWSLPPAMTGLSGPLGSAPTGNGGGAELPASTIIYLPLEGPLIVL